MNGLIPAVMAATAALLLMLGVREWLTLARDRRRFVAGAELITAQQNIETTLQNWNNRFRRTRFGRWLSSELDLAGLPNAPLAVAASGVGGAIAITWAIWVYLAPPLAALGLIAAFLLVRGYLRRAQQRRQEAIVAQLPELARVLANASFAGLSLPTALGVASRELAEPARSELARISDHLKFGATVEGALREFRERVRSREAGVLVSALVVSSRSGGSIVTALRGIADSLEQRKETRRQIKTTLSGPMVTANLIIVMSIGLLLLLNTMQPGTVDKMTRSPIGIIGLLLSGLLFAGGYLIIRRLARIDP